MRCTLGTAVAAALLVTWFALAAAVNRTYPDTGRLPSGLHQALSPGEGGASPLPAEEEMVYSTESGVYFHAVPDCSGMKNAAPRTICEALSLGQEACPVCQPLKDMVWATQGGTYYHAALDCSGMEDALPMTVAHAQEQGKQPCPVCINATPTQQPAGETFTAAWPTEEALPSARPIGEVLPTARPTQSAAEAEQIEQVRVYSTENGVYFHAMPDCSGMEGAVERTLSQAMAMGQGACPVCDPLSAWWDEIFSAGEPDSQGVRPTEAATTTPRPTGELLPTEAATTTPRRPGNF